MERLRIAAKVKLWYPDGNAIMDSYGEDLLENNRYHHVNIPDYVGIKGACLIDVGAYVGVFTEWAIRRGAYRAFCFEPVYDNYRCLIANKNERPSWIDVQAYPYALMSRTGFYSMEGEGQKATVTEDSPSNRILGISFDDFYSCLNIDPEEHVIIKMDIEGQEVSAIEGAKDFLQKYKKVTFILCTYHYTEQYEHIAALLEHTLTSFSHVGVGSINGNTALMIASNWREI